MLDLLHRQKVLDTNNFAICFAREGGYMTLGGYRPDKHLPGEPVQSVPYTDNYKVGVLGVKVNFCNLGRKEKCVQEKIQCELDDYQCDVRQRYHFHFLS